MSDGSLKVTRIADGIYRVEHDERSDIVYVAGPPGDRWGFWNGQVFRGDSRLSAAADRPAPRRARSAQSLAAPMPARVIWVAVRPGAVVKKGETVVLLEAMKMELPVRAPADATVVAVHCHEGELVQADALLVELLE